MGEMGFHRAPGDEEAPADLHVGESLGHESHDLELGGSEAFPPPRRPPASPPPTSPDSQAPEGRFRAGQIHVGADTLIGPDGLPQLRRRFLAAADPGERGGGVLAGVGSLDRA
jgi:hypothetical protein